MATQLALVEAIRRCRRCGEVFPERTTHFHADRTTAASVTHQCRWCRNRRDRERHHRRDTKPPNERFDAAAAAQEFATRQTQAALRGETCPTWAEYLEMQQPTTTDSQPLLERRWCPVCSTTHIEVVCSECGTQVHQLTVGPMGDLVLDIETDLGRGMGHYRVRALAVESRGRDGYAYRPQEIESAQRLLVDVWIPVAHEPTLRGLHAICWTVLKREGWGRRRA